MTNYRRRWSDNDRYFGPFTYAYAEKGDYRPFGIAVLSSGDDEDDDRCTIRFRGFGHTLIAPLPPIIRPYRVKVFPNWGEETVERVGRDWYWDVYKREYGFSIHDGHLSVNYGRQTMDSTTDMSKGWFLPWTQWRVTRRAHYDRAGTCFWRHNGRTKLPSGTEYEAFQKCPAVMFSFTDFDGVEIMATTRIKEFDREKGVGWFKWISFFYDTKTDRHLDIKFSSEVGQEKGSWKGGVIGTGLTLEPGELHESGFRRFCSKRKLTFNRRVE